MPFFEKKVVVQKYWIVSEQVDKTLLRQEVQEFCDQFPIYRLQEVDLNPTTKAKTEDTPVLVNSAKSTLKNGVS